MNSNSPDRLTETDSGQWSSSFPSSPIKEQSPVHQTATTTISTRQSAHSLSSRKSDLYGTPHWAPSAWDENDENCDQNEMTLNSLTSQSSSMTASRQGSHEILRATPPPPTPQQQQQQQQQVQNLKSMAFTIDFCERKTTTTTTDTSDVKSDNGTYTLDDEPREPVDLCSDGNNGDNNYNGVNSGSVIGSGAQDNWIVKWASDAAGRLNSYGDCQQYNNNETKEILSETEKIVESMQSRVTNVQRSKSNLSPGTAKKYPAASMIKFNRAFNIRRTLNTNSSNASYDSDGSNGGNNSRPPAPVVVPPAVVAATANNNNNNAHFSRSDGGRFSLRMSRGDKRNFNSESDPEGRATIPANRSQHFSRQSNYRPPSQQQQQQQKLQSNSPLPSKFTPQQSHKIPPNTTTSTTGSSALKKSIRSNSTMSSRDIELENWRRRKSYDPLKSSGMISQRMNCSVNNVSSANDFNHKETPTSNLTKDRKKSLTDNQQLQRATSSLQDSSSSETRKKDFLKRSSMKPINPPPSPTASKGGGSSLQLVPQQCCGKSRIENTTFSCGEEHARVFPEYKNHCQMQGHLEQRKFEALDTLVISTIHSLSTKVRNLSLNLLKKIQPTHGEDENGALIEEMITQLTELSQSQNCNNTTSKELSGTLKNIKKIEQVVLVLDRVFCDEDSSESED